MNAAEIKDTFAALDSWEDRYQFIIELGKELPKFPEHFKIEANKIHGCQSQVWMVAKLNDTVPATVSFLADSDAHIVRGLIAIVRGVYEGQTPQYILNYDIEQFLEEIQLHQHLSSGRGNGLKEMVKRVKALAASF